MITISRFCALIGLMLVLLAAEASFGGQELRTALVIGNADYKSSPLANPVNDAVDLAGALQKLGFEVLLRKNATQREMEEAIFAFGRALQKGGAGLFYFAGHGIQVDGRNYLIPIGAEILQETDVKYEAVDAGRVLDTMDSAGNELNIVVLDACRDNPFARSFRSATEGLARMDAPKGTLIAYSTSPGRVAFDGTGKNSPFTSALLKYMKIPGLTVEEVFKNVRKDIDASTQGKQVPWESTSLTGDFSFNFERAITVKKRPQPKTEVLTAQSSQLAVKGERRVTSDSAETKKYFVLLARDGLDEAFRYFRESNKNYPSDEDIRAGLAVSLVFKGEEEGARYQLLRLKEAKVKTPSVRIAMGLVEGLYEYYVDGICQLKRAQEEGGDNALVELCIAMIAEKNGDSKRAQRALEDYKALVPTYERGQGYHKLSERIEITNKLAGTYYVPYGQGRDLYQFGIVLSNSNGALEGRLSADSNPHHIPNYYTLQKISFENGNLSFSVRQEFRGLWSINEYEAQVRDNFQRIPMQVTQVAGNCGQNGSTGQTVLIRDSSISSQGETLRLEPGGVPLAHSKGCFISAAAGDFDSGTRDLFSCGSIGKWPLAMFSTLGMAAAERPIAFGIILFVFLGAGVYFRRFPKKGNDLKRE